MSSYKLRAEGLGDVLQLFPIIEITKYKIEGIGFPDVEFTFETSESKEVMMEKLRVIDDAHVMHETLELEADYTGERKRIEPKKLSLYQYDYNWLGNQNPTSYGGLINSLGQEIEFVEHPLQGDESFVICVSHELKLAEDSTFFDLDDMAAEHREYEPSFKDGNLLIGGSLAHD